MKDYNEGDYVIATIDLKPYFLNNPDITISKGAVGEVISSINDEYVRFASIKWYSEELNGEDISIDTTKGIKKLKDKKEFEKIAGLYSLGY